MLSSVVGILLTGSNIGWTHRVLSFMWEKLTRADGGRALNPNEGNRFVRFVRRLFGRETRNEDPR